MWVLYDYECGHQYEYECGDFYYYECRSYITTNIAVRSATNVEIIMPRMSKLSCYERRSYNATNAADMTTNVFVYNATNVAVYCYECRR